MDNLTYDYYDEDILPNSLEGVIDAENSGLWNQTQNVEPEQVPFNYQYDGIGNLVPDLQSEVNKIVWNVFGKVKSITFVDSKAMNSSMTLPAIIFKNHQRTQRRNKNKQLYTTCQRNFIKFVRDLHCHHHAEWQFANGQHL